MHYQHHQIDSSSRGSLSQAHADDHSLEYRRWHRVFRLHTLDHWRVGGARLFSTGYLVAIRAAFFVYTLFGWIFSIIFATKNHEMQYYFIRFTYLCYTGLLFYLGASLYHTYQLWRRGAPSSFSNMPRTLQLMHWLLFASALLYATVVSVMFWSLIYKSADYPTNVNRWINISVHGTNFFIMWTDMVLGSMMLSPHWSHTLFFTVVVVLYLSLTYINEAASGWFPYDFINYRIHKEKQIGINIGMLAGFVLMYYVLYGLQLLLDRFSPPNFTLKPPPADDEDMSSPMLN
ncbi:hypothetical protein LPJ66_009244 [Kickxella alabastrina]|uniref:Uncharacterized protein n=1 Tax=Kickxella alabastrina TaxID=61397 RepID=A0ACC1I7G0_9FUNG|nr:hypothetical protein LPJ66_009244 [Kickxella alabastrina]